MQADFAKFAIPLLLEEAKFYEESFRQYVALNEKKEKLDRRIDIKHAMDAFDAQFNKID